MWTRSATSRSPAACRTGTNILADGMQDDARGIQMNRGEAVYHVMAPGVLLDYPAMLGVDCVPETYDVTGR